MISWASKRVEWFNLALPLMGVFSVMVAAASAGAWWAVALCAVGETVLVLALGDLWWRRSGGKG